MSDSTQPNGSNGNGNGWTRYGELVLTQLEQHQEEIAKTNDRIGVIKEVDLPKIQTDLATLKTKVILWSAIGSTLFSGLVFAILSYFIHH